MHHRTLISRSLLCAAVLLVCCGTGLLAQDTLVLLNPPNNGDSAGGVYTSPYNISVNGTPMQLICDDFTTDISVGESWPASANTFTYLDSSNVTALKFGNAGDEPNGTNLLSSNTVEDYGIAAVLAAELMSTPGLSSDQIAGYSFAIWDVFDNGLVGSSSCGNDPYGSLTSAQCTDASNDLTAAENVVTAALNASGNDTLYLNQLSVNGSPISSFTVYTPVVPPGPNAQEFLQVRMDEPSFPAVLAFDLLGVLGLVACLRLRIIRIHQS